MQKNNCDCDWYHCVHWAIQHELDRARARLDSLSENDKKKIVEILNDVVKDPD